MRTTSFRLAALLVGFLCVAFAGDYQAVGSDARPGFLYGRVTTEEGTTYLGRLRFGRDQEAFWGDYFNGVKDGNRWAVHAPSAVTKKRSRISIFGFDLPFGDNGTDLGRPFMARFGDISRIEALGRVVRVTLKSGTAFDVVWSAANDFDDGVRVWDETRGVVDLASWAGGIPPPARVRMRSIDFLRAGRIEAAPSRLHGTVRTAHGAFTGFIQWDRRDCVGADELVGRTSAGDVRLRFDTIRSIARRSRDSALVTLLDGREIALSGTRDVGAGNAGIYVDDRRYGRVLASWDAFERIDFSAGGNGPSYEDFPRGGPLMGSVVTRGGRRLTGRLVYDLDESETTETLDAPAQGVDYTIPFGLVASIAPAAREENRAARASVRLHSGEELLLERAGDLGAGNAGLLIFVDGQERPEYVAWAEIDRIEFVRPAAMYPPSSVSTR
jgi:hypothetical protein